VISTVDIECIKEGPHKNYRKRQVAAIREELRKAWISFFLVTVKCKSEALIDMDTKKVSELKNSLSEIRETAELLEHKLEFKRTLLMERVI
jgi:hypothetical protein